MKTKTSAGAKAPGDKKDKKARKTSAGAKAPQAKKAKKARKTRTGAKASAVTKPKKATKTSAGRKAPGTKTSAGRKAPGTKTSAGRKAAASPTDEKQKVLAKKSSARRKAPSKTTEKASAPAETEELLPSRENIAAAAARAGAKTRGTQVIPSATSAADRVASRRRATAPAPPVETVVPERPEPKLPVPRHSAPPPDDDSVRGLVKVVVKEVARGALRRLSQIFRRR